VAGNLHIEQGEATLAIQGHRNQTSEIKRADDRRTATTWGTLTALAIMLVLTCVATQLAQAQTFKVIYTFDGQTDGANPYAGVTIDKAGNLYGTNTAGGTEGYGTVFKLKLKGESWILSPLYNFTGGSDGKNPQSRVIIGPDGALYGTTFNGGGKGCGVNGCGIVFSLRPPMAACKAAMCPWKETVLYQFSGGTDGGEPTGDILFDKAGNIYGTTEIGGMAHRCGGLGCGAVFELSRSGSSWTETVLYQFSGGTDGAFPNSGVIFDDSGNLYGTTDSGGSSAYGTVFKLTHSGSGWTEQVLYNFLGLNDGSQPDSGLILDSQGNLYGTTLLNGTGGGGTVFQLTPSNGNWTINVLYGLSGIAGPIANLNMDAAGNLYGTTFQDGVHLVGSLLKLSPSRGGWIYSSLHDFTGGNDGQLPISSIVFDSNGNLYGTASSGGSSGLGVVVEITP
jgi:uncharacterized repeat protein (TIGR03803 family)